MFVEVVARWVDVEVVVEGMALRGSMEKYRCVVGCETSLVGVDVRRQGDWWHAQWCNLMEQLWIRFSAWRH